eukprot:89433_1
MGKRKLGGRYELGRTLGVGAFGKVKCATNLKTGAQVAIKILNRADIKKHGLINSVRTEVTALQLIPPHKHIVNLIEVLESKLTLYLVLELVSGGELFDKIKLEGKLNDDVARHYYRQLISALEFMHERKICHRDLKLENLLVDQDGVLKVTDFGLSGLHTGGDEVFKTTLGSPNYVAPDVLIGRGYDGFKADIWSSGVILYVLLAGFLPFDEDNANELFKKICTGDFRYPQTFSNQVIDLLNNILVVDPTKRYSLDEIKLHPWFQSAKEEDAYFTPDVIEEDGLMISATDHKDLINQIETPRSSHKFSKNKPNRRKPWDDDEMAPHSAPSLKSAFGSMDSMDDGYSRYSTQDEKKTKSIKKSKSQKMRDVQTQGTHQKRRSLQIRLETYDPELDTAKEEKYDDVMEQFPSASPQISQISSDVSDYQTSDIDSSPSHSPRHIEPISMTAFDLIGIVSTQMLNNVFTRSLQETATQIKTYTRFVSNSTPPKILYAIQEAVHRIADCTCRVASDRYEIKVVKRKGHRTIHINIQIFQTPVVNEYMIECRRTQGNIFKYHEFYEEFEKQYKNVIQHLHKTQPGQVAKVKKTQIKFRSKESNNHARSASDYGVLAKAQPLHNVIQTEKEIIDNIPSLQELSTSRSHPHTRGHNKDNPSNISIKSSASSASGGVPSHHSSVSSAPSSDASPTPSHEKEHKELISHSAPANISQSFSMEDDHHNAVSVDVDVDVDADVDINGNELKPNRKHRRSSSGQGQTYAVTKTGHLALPSQISETGK